MDQSDDQTVHNQYDSDFINDQNLLGKRHFIKHCFTTFLAVVNMSHIRHPIATPLPVIACFPASTGCLCRRKSSLTRPLRHYHYYTDKYLFNNGLCQQKHTTIESHYDTKENDAKPIAVGLCVTQRVVVSYCRSVVQG